MIEEPPLQPLSYHRALAALLRDRYSEIWDWFASDELAESDLEDVRLALLKSTYRLEREAHPELYELTGQTLEKLGLEAPTTLYQSQDEAEANAFVAYVPGEVHVVFCGPILRLLDPGETAALLGHELTHFLLWDYWNREYLTAHRIVAALANDPQSDSSHDETVRLERLFTEILADRGALRASGDLLQAVGMLVKVVTGLPEASAASYLKQADEVFAREDFHTAELTHPEAFLRARALRLWSEWSDIADDEIVRMIRGPQELDRLDLLGQVCWSGLTRRLLRTLLAPAWFQTDSVVAHARHFFDDFELPAEDHRDDELAADVEVSDAGLRDYVCYLIVDFVALARELEEAPFAAGFTLADRLGVGDRLVEVLAKELRVGKRKLGQIRRDAAHLLETAGR